MDFRALFEPSNLSWKLKLFNIIAVPQIFGTSYSVTALETTLELGHQIKSGKRTSFDILPLNTKCFVRNFSLKVWLPQSVKTN